jgi:hypothetical protein
VFEKGRLFVEELVVWTVLTDNGGFRLCSEATGLVRMAGHVAGIGGRVVTYFVWARC